MQPWVVADRGRAPDGSEVLLACRGEEWVVRLGGRLLVSSRVHGSEEALASLALAKLSQRRAILVGGLGLGFTIRAVLDRVPSDARVILAELIPQIVTWNRGPVGHLAGHPLEDARVRTQIGSVFDRIAEATKAFDAILLDVDNGPSSPLHSGNARLYSPVGVQACRNALRANGVLAIWSASPDRRYEERLLRAGFATETHTTSARGAAKGVRHTVLLAVKPGVAEATRGLARAQNR